MGGGGATVVPTPAIRYRPVHSCTTRVYLSIYVHVQQVRTRANFNGELATRDRLLISDNCYFNGANSPGIAAARALSATDFIESTGGLRRRVRVIRRRRRGGRVKKHREFSSCRGNAARGK